MSERKARVESGLQGFTWVAFGLKGDVLWDWGQGAHNHKRQARDRCTQDSRRAKTDDGWVRGKMEPFMLEGRSRAVPVI